MSKIFLMKCFSPPVRTLHRLGGPSHPTLSHHPSRSREGHGAARASPALGIGHLPGYRDGSRLGQEVWKHLPMSPKEWTTWSCPVSEPALSWQPDLPNRDAPRVPHSPLMRQVTIAGNVLLLLKGEEGKAILLPYHLLVTSRCMWFLFLWSIPSQKKSGKIEGWYINKTENMEENERLINCHSCASMSPGTIRVLQFPVGLILLSQYLLLLSKRWWEWCDWHMSYVWHSFTWEREIG